MRRGLGQGSPNGKALSENEAEPYVVNFIIVDADGDGMLTVEEFKWACTSGLMTDAAAGETSSGDK
jgi:hypothetical protein